MIERYLTTEEAASVVCRSTSTLAKWRCKGFGPPFYEVGGRILYDPDELREFVESRRCRSTSDRERRRRGRSRRSGPDA